MTYRIGDISRDAWINDLLVDFMRPRARAIVYATIRGNSWTGYYTFNRHNAGDQSVGAYGITNRPLFISSSPTHSFTVKM